jgi:hypothetical protein
LFLGLRRDSAAKRLREERLYERVVYELAHGKRRNGLWAKALADSKGEKERAKALYIQYRVQSIKDELQVSVAPNSQRSNEESRSSSPSGIGGWLLLLILGMMVFGPALGAARIAGALMSAELDYPAVLTVKEWATYKTTTWSVFCAIALASCYGGWGLAFRREWSAVTRAKLMLWVAGPLGSLILGIAVPTIVFSDASTIDPSFLGTFIGSVIAASLWTAYLRYSKRVRNTYAQQSTVSESSDLPQALDWNGIWRWAMGGSRGFVAFFFLFGRDWFDFSAGLLDADRDSPWVILLGLALLANLLTGAIWLLSRLSTQIRQSWPFEPILSSQSPATRLLLIISGLQWLLVALFIFFRVAP